MVERIKVIKDANAIKVIKAKGKELEQEFRSRTIGYILTALGLVAGLAWNDTIKAIIEQYFPADAEGSIKAQLIYAILVTVVVVIISIYLTKLIKDDDEESKK